MALRSNHYELAFEAYLRTVRTPYVAVDESRRTLLAEASLKSMDFIVYAAAAPHLLVDVKGRRFPSAEGRGNSWESWASTEDVSAMLQWELFFGAGFRAAFIFAYDLQETAPQVHSQVWDFRQRRYAFYGVWVSDYVLLMRQRSPRWETVSLPAADYRQVRRPLTELLQGV